MLLVFTERVPGAHTDRERQRYRNYSAGRHVLPTMCNSEWKDLQIQEFALAKRLEMDSQSNQETRYTRLHASHTLWEALVWPICPFSAQSPWVTWFSSTQNKQLFSQTLASPRQYTHHPRWRHSSLFFWRTWVRGEEVFLKLKEVNQNR